MGFMNELVIISMLLPIAFCTLVEQEQTNGMVEEPETSSHRRAGNMTPLEQYARDKYEEYVSESGKLQYGVDEPTNVWFLPDKDVAQGYFRAKPQRTTECATYTQYVFQWRSVASAIENTALSVRSSILRVYIQPISSHIKNSETVNVTLTIKVIPRNGNETTNSSDSILAGQQVISVSHDSDGWAELNVTKGAIDIWPLSKNYAEVQVIIIAEVDCIEQKMVPIKFVNPAEIPLDKPLRREHYLSFQPFLVINADNEMKKNLLRQQQEEAVNEQQTDDTSSTDPINELLQYSETSIRSKRQSIPDICSRSSYTVNLTALFPYIILPEEIDIFKCSGACVLSRTSMSRHAKIMAHFSVNATYPCCVPTKYNTIEVLIRKNRELHIEELGAVIATECGCR